jgi:hypothetical protein
MTNQQKSNIFVVIALLCFIGLIWALIEIILNKYYISRDYRYTISTKVSLGSSTRTGTQRRYFFTVKYEKYVGITSTYLDTDSTYFIKYYPPNPDRNEATLVIANENDIKNLPQDGYKELPHN